MRKFYPILICTIILTLTLYGCGHSETNSIMEKYGSNILIIDSDNITNGAFQDLCEVTQNTQVKTNKQFKFFILSETTAESPSEIAKIKDKVLEGYIIIYPQTDKDKLTIFLQSFSTQLENNSYNVNGCILKRDLNTTTQSYYIQANPSYSNKATSYIDYIKSQIESAIILKLPNKDKSEFLGIYISKAIYSGSDLKEITPFYENVQYDKFDAFNSTKDKKFTFSFNNKQLITYSTYYEISKSEIEFFYAYIINKDFYGNINAVPLKNSAFTHSGIKYTLTEEIQIYSGEMVITDIPELLKITFKFI